MKQSLTTDNIISILKDLGATVEKETSSEIIFSSICCHLDADYHKKKLYWYKSSNTFFCFKCNFSGDIFSLVAHRGKLQGNQHTFPEVINYVMSICGFENTKFERKQKADIYDWQSDLSKYLHIETQANQLKIYDKNVLNFFDDKYHQSWLNEGISIETLMKYNIKYYPLHDSIIIPCYDEQNQLIGIRERFMRPEDIENGKYKPLRLLDGTQYNFPTNQIFFGINHNQEAIYKSQTVWLVESEKAVMHFDTWFGDDNVALAMYGSNLGKRRRDMLVDLGVSNIVIMLDSDFKVHGDNEYIAFEKKVMNLASSLKGFFNISVCYNNQGYDGYKFAPCDFSREQFDILYKNREVIE